MKKINVRFEADKTIDDVEIVIRAAEKDDQIVSLIEKLSADESVKLTLLDRNNCSCVIDEEEIVLVSADGKNVRVTATGGKYDFTIGGTLRIEFSNGMETWASRRYIPLIRQRLSGEEGYLC